MKHLFICFILIVQTISVHPQNSARQQPASSVTSATSRWNLDAFVWSHTHPAPDKNDKPLLDFDALDNWVSLPAFEKVIVSPDGQFISHRIIHNNDINRNRDSVVVKSISGNWRQVFTNSAQLGFFSPDSRQYVFQSKQGLYFLQTGTEQCRFVKGVVSYQTPANSYNEWLAYQLNNQDNTVVLLNLVTGKEKRFNGMASYRFDNAGQWFLCQSVNANKDLGLYNIETGVEKHFQGVENYIMNDNAKSITLIRTTSVGGQDIYTVQYLALLPDMNGSLETIKTIWSGTHSMEKVGTIILDGRTSQVMIMVQQESGGSSSNKNESSLWYWKEGMDRAEMKLNDKTLESRQKLNIKSLQGFTDNSQYFRFTLQPMEPKVAKPLPGAVKLDVWSYSDKILQSAQPNFDETRTVTGVLNLQTNQLILPEKEYENLGVVRGYYALISKAGKDVYGDRFWEKGYYDDSVWLISLQSGVRRLLPTKKSYFTRFSPEGKYLVYCDETKQCNYFSIELATGKVANISKEVPSWQLGLKWSFLRSPEKPKVGSGIKLWLEGDKGFLVYDNYHDIWQLDPSGKEPAECITNGYGRLHDIEFKLLVTDDHSNRMEAFIGNDTLLLSACNTKKQWQGFYRKELGKKGNPQLLSMAPCYMPLLRDGSNGVYPIRAANAGLWIVNRQSATESPNYFLTRDFKTFKQITFLQPHKNYNWLTAELHSFKQMDGTISQGVLYKPENFNPEKKYPVIISFYGSLSDQLYHYPNALYIDAPHIYENPAWMVSHGYLVFLPDIYFSKNQWGPSTVNTVDGAARYLRKLPYVDGTHLGAIGHSNSGRFGYYLLTHSHSFAALSFGSGLCGGDVLTGALSTQGNGTSNLEVAEKTAYGTALGNIWQNKGQWIDHIAPLQADKVTSPFLLYHDKLDPDDIRLAIELFIALRRLEKKSWWLSYDYGAHGVWGDNARDFSIRFTQFFDHYLKGAPPPKWMTQGIPYKLKGIETGYELDMKGKCGTDCKICKALKMNNVSK